MTYLDNAATSFPKPEGVYAALDRFARTSLANPGRSGHRMAQAAEHALADARHRLNRFFNGRSPERFVFTLNATDALNMAVKGVIRDGDHVVTSDLEHNSVSRPLVALAAAGRITLTRVAADGGGTLDPDAIRAAFTPRTRLVALTHASNVLGTVQPVAEIGRLVRERDALFLVDAAQTAGVVPIDVQALCIDLLAVPGHKSLLGPTGTGVLYAGPRTAVKPWREGGTGGDSLTPTQPAEFPHLLEGGTPNVLGVAGLVAGLDFVEERGVEAIRRHEVGLCDRAAGGAARPAGVRGVRPRRPGPPGRRAELPLRDPPRAPTSAASSTRRSTSPSARGSTARRTSTRRSAPPPTAWCASAPGRSRRRRTSTGWSARSGR
jgi:cysteine desulfurase/selenocysteine lyase